MWSRDKSWVENFLSSWSVLLFGVLAVTSLVLRYVTDPIHCNLPPQLADAGQVQEYCFQQTELLMLTDELLSYMSEPRVGPLNLQALPRQRTYHQWVPFALGVAAILCLVPHVIGRMLSGLVWVDAHALLRSLWENRGRKMEERRDALRDSALFLQAGLRGSNWILTPVALFRKAMTCALCVVLVVSIALLFTPPLGAGPHQQQGDNGSVPLPTDRFLCFYQRLHPQNIQSVVAQCSLPLNQVFLRGFAFLFYLFLLLLIICVLDLLYWAGRLFLPTVRDSAPIRHLSVISQSQTPGHVTDPAEFYRFLQTLGVDGRLILALIADNCGPLVAADLINHLWLAFKGTPRLGPAPSTPPDSAHLREQAVDWLGSKGQGEHDAVMDRKSDEIALSPLSE